MRSMCDARQLHGIATPPIWLVEIETRPNFAPNVFLVALTEVASVILSLFNVHVTFSRGRRPTAI